jgi:hypothetical protein
MRLRGHSRGAYKVAWEAARLYRPEAAWTIDVCRTVHDNYYVLELNSFSCSGLYKCDKDAVVRAVSRAALEDWQRARA